eukprot:TRINITY_DN11432_c0_g2_i2.p1 TRINITY_DN11432_c0_g2~~TRINITY_DN11432_c0_g2_i2.p1  ORF type:complete len:182 (+),score=32.93 TRINITY_DN11432_c0_g2_i2:243-788(+)
MSRWLLAGMGTGAYVGWTAYTQDVKTQVPALLAPMLVEEARERWGDRAYLDLFDHPIQGDPTCAPGAAAASLFESRAFAPESCLLGLFYVQGRLPNCVAVLGGEHLAWKVVSMTTREEGNSGGRHQQTRDEVLLHWGPVAGIEGLTYMACLLYTSDAADEEDSVDLGGRRIIKKKKNKWYG